MDSAEFHARVYEAVRQIPPGKATSYGHIAKLIGMPRHSRHVGQALKFLDPDSDVPWYRVVSSTGAISSRGPGTSGAQRQRDALEAEGIAVDETAGGEMKVRWATHGWFPESLVLEGAAHAGAQEEQEAGAEEAEDGEGEEAAQGSAHDSDEVDSDNLDE